MNNKLALVLPGGGLKCAYQAGALVALGTQFACKPDIVVASSGGVGNALYYLAGQCDYAERAWKAFLPTPTFVRHFPFPKIRVDYLVDTIFKVKLPMDIAAVNRSGARYFIPATDAETGETKFFDNDSPSNIFEIARASMAVPIFYGRKIPLEGRRYIDGDVSAHTTELIAQAIHAGAERILCIDNRRDPNLLTRIALRLVTGIPIKQLSATNFHENRNVIMIEPSVPLPLTSVTRNRRKIVSAFQMGYDDVMKKRADILTLCEESARV